MKSERWDTYHCLLLFAASVSFIFTHHLFFFIVPALMSFMLLFFFNRNELRMLKPYAGWANRITAFRFLAIVVLAYVYQNLSDIQIACWLGATIPLDGLDGYLARKRQEQTLMGAYLDMETDAFFVCIVSCMLFLRGLSGYEVLIIGFFRYFYVIIIYLCGFQYIKEQKTRIGPIVAVFVFIALTLSFVLPDGPRKLIIYSALILLTVSFSYSFWLLLNTFRNKKIRGN
jgi:phosphatidylglycerophosphate synthase